VLKSRFAKAVKEAAFCSFGSEEMFQAGLLPISRNSMGEVRVLGLASWVRRPKPPCFVFAHCA